MRKLLLFDIDGTILNMKKGVSKRIFIDTFFDIYGVAPTMEQMPHFAGNTDLQILYQMADAVGLDKDIIQSGVQDFWNMKLERFKKYCTNEYVQTIPGIEKLLEHLSQNNEFELSLTTGNSRKNSFQKLSSHNLEVYFDGGAFGCERSDRNLLPPLAIGRANAKYKSQHFSEKNTVIIGDTQSDINAAKSNNLKMILFVDLREKKMDILDGNSDSIITDYSNQDYFYQEVNRICN